MPARVLRVIDRVQKRKQFTGLVAVAEHRKCDHRPDGAMRILAAVLPNAGRVAFDVARVGRLLDRTAELRAGAVRHRDGRDVRPAPPWRLRRELCSRRRISPPTTARSNRSCIRCLRPNPAVFHHRRRRAGTSRRPSLLARAILPARLHAAARSRPAFARREFPPTWRKLRAWREGTSRARCFRPCRRRRPD